MRELVTGREAARILDSTGLTRERARRLLHTGIAGTPTRIGRTLLYDRGKVQELANRPHVDPDTLDPICQSGVVVARIATFDTTASRADQVTRLQDGWRIALSMHVWVVVHAQMNGCVPFVATVSGYVVFGADLRTAAIGDRWLLDAPGDWFADVDQRWLRTTPGGPWTLWLHDQVHERPGRAGPATTPRRTRSTAR